MADVAEVLERDAVCCVWGGLPVSCAGGEGREKPTSCLNPTPDGSEDHHDINCCGSLLSVLW